MRKPKNTKKQGILQFMVYPNSGGRFTAVCFELGLVREGADPLKLRGRILTLARRYVESICANGLNDDLLNQKLPAKYLRKLEQAERAAKEYANLKKWQKAFEALIWQETQKRGKLLTTESLLGSRS